MDHNPTIGLFSPTEDGTPFLTKSTRRRERREAGRRKKKTAAERRQRIFRFRRALEERKNRFATRVGREPATNELRWQEKEACKMHTGLLQASVRQIGSTDPGTPLFRDVAAWVEAHTPSAPFSFEACCAQAKEPPAEVRMRVAALILARATLQARRPGKPGNAARQWLAGDASAPMSFERVCEILGRDPAMTLGKVAAAA